MVGAVQTGEFATIVMIGSHAVENTCTLWNNNAHITILSYNLVHFTIAGLGEGSKGR